MQVTHVAPSYFDPTDGIIGGAERYTLELAKCMAKRTKTTLVSFGNRDFKFTVENLKGVILGNPWRIRNQQNNPFSFKLMPLIANSDIVHFHQKNIFCFSFGALTARLMGKRAFVTDLGGGGWDVSAYFNTDRWFHGHLHISQYSKKIHGHEFNPNARVIYGGVDPEKFSPPSPSQPRDRVVYVGRILPHKGIRYLIEAMPSDLPLEVIGRPYDSDYFKKLKGLARGKSVAFRTEATDEEVIREYQKAICVVLPSVYEEDGMKTNVPELLGQTLLEGMACGAPGLATSVASLPEVVEEGVSGILVPPNDASAIRKAIENFRANPNRTRKMGEKARRRVLTKFNWGAVVDKCLKIYGM